LALITKTTSTPLSILATKGGILAFYGRKPVTDIWRLFLNNQKTMKSDLLATGFKTGFHGPKDALTLLLDYMWHHSPTELSPKVRVEICTQMALSGWHNQSQLFRIIMGRNAIDQDLLQIEGHLGLTLVDAVALALALEIGDDIPTELILDSGFSTPASRKEFIDCVRRIRERSWVELLRDLIKAGGDLHHKNGLSLTPLLTAWASLDISSVSHPGEFSFWRKRKVKLRAWLQYLKDAGVSLEEYGRVEFEDLCCRNSRVNTSLFPLLLGLNVDSVTTIRLWRNLERRPLVELIGFSYGPLPEDWSVLESEPTDIFAGQFWNLIENPEPRLPGAWVSEDSDEVDPAEISSGNSYGEESSDEESEWEIS
jgi:hypothetical protein